MKRSQASLRREAIRNSAETLEFKTAVNQFLADKPDYIEYSIKRDLAVMTNMPFYKDRPKRVPIRIAKDELLINWMEIFVEHEDFDFISNLIRKLNRNQNQLIRKIAPRIGSKKDIWEHAIPSNFIVNELINMVEANDISDLPRLLEIYMFAGQRPLTKEQDLLLNEYRSTMPESWNWRSSDANPLERYLVVGIDVENL